MGDGPFRGTRLRSLGLPSWLWRTTAALDALLIIAVRVLNPPSPPGALTFAMMFGVLFLAYFSAVALAFSK